MRPTQRVPGWATAGGSRGPVCWGSCWGSWGQQGEGCKVILPEGHGGWLMDARDQLLSAAGEGRVLPAWPV